jgi:uncharacterized protein YfaS (alpha-2-macroglobulin family)
MPAAKSDTESKAAAKELGNERADTKSATAKEAPAALYFNPQLTTDENGLAKIRFVMPAVESQYRLMIDALGNNRIGARQDILVCSPDAPAAAAKPSPP